MNICKYDLKCSRPCPDDFETCARYKAITEFGIDKVDDEFTTISYWRIIELAKGDD